ncbi:hypothetical protein ABE459_03935 [Pseudomonas sp. TWI923]|uniref:hypothetical protein n=1 Tax=Pseudomonas sp. TWI923 TaxID=3136794 RepID=UPI003207F747
MHCRESMDPLTVIKYAAMMAACSRQPWAVYMQQGKRLVANPYRGKQTDLVEVCRP